MCQIAYSVCRKQWADMIGTVNDLVYVCAPAPLQIGVAAGILELTTSYYEELCAQFKKKRDNICSTLETVGLKPIIPQGAYYVLADGSSLPEKDSKEKAMFLLECTGVASVPGKAFYHDDRGENLLRFCFAKEDDILDEACLRLEKLKLG
jgi:aminotransferase